MMDLMKSLAARRDEISNYITEVQKEREHLISRLSEIDQSTASAERDHRRIQRAMEALDGDNEPRESMGKAVDALMPTVPPYRPGE